MPTQTKEQILDKAREDIMKRRSPNPVREATEAWSKMYEDAGGDPAEILVICQAKLAEMGAATTPAANTQPSSYDCAAYDGMELLPTPPVGTWVWWYERNIRHNPAAALVTGREDAGRLILEVHRAGKQPTYSHTGVYYVDSDFGKIPNHPISGTKGTWDYIANADPPAADYDYHRQIIREKQEAQRRHMAAVAAAKQRGKPLDMHAVRMSQLAEAGMTH